MRLTYAVRSIGKASQTFCAVMNHPSPSAKFSPYQKILLEGLEFLASKSMKDAVKKGVNIDGSKDLTAEFNPSCQKLGHTSLNCCDSHCHKFSYGGCTASWQFQNGSLIPMQLLACYCDQVEKCKV
ncbi:Uncharacterized protein GBIM_20682 [Gryllus bimaculatus]|nr:Uncharacterized protein GBIM_20682 [Gryllus bimaculatus]